MSSILKALKKLEEEKSRQEENNPLNITRDILKPESRSGISARWLWSLAISAIAVIFVLSSALYRTSTKKGLPSASTLQTADVATPAPSATAPAPMPPLPAGSKPSIKAVPKSHIDGAQQKSTAASSLPKTDTLQKTAPMKTTALPAQPPNAVPNTITAATPVLPDKKEPALTLSGIAWNKDSADRLAIINGQPAATGANVNGVIVEEILQDRVKLSHNGRIFELLIGRDARMD